VTAFSTLAETFSILEQTSSRSAMVRELAGRFREIGPEEIRESIYLLQGQLGPSYDAPQFGISEKLSTRALAALFEVPVETIEAEYRTRGDHGIVAEALMTKSPRARRRGRGLSIVEVFKRLKALAEAAGAGSVEAKIRALVELVGQSSPLEARFLLRIPLGRLRLGVGDPTILDALSEAKAGDRSLRPALERAYNLCSDLGLVAHALYTSGSAALETFTLEVGRPIKMQFAERAASIEDIVRRLGLCAVEPKYDGFRCQVHKTGATVRVFSRNQEDTTAMFPDVQRATMKQLDVRQAIFEGEALAFDAETGEFHPFQVTVQRKRRHGISEMEVQLPLILNVFDVLYVDGKDLTPHPYRKRRDVLERLIRRGSGLAVAPALISADAAEITRFFEEQIGSGLEGIVAKRLDSAYEAGKRNFNWIKFKRAYQGSLRDTVDLAIVGYFAGRGQRAKLGIGAVLGAVYDKQTDRFRTLAKVASGLSEAEWIALRNRLDQIRVPHRPARVDSRIEPAYWVDPTLVVEVFADEITKSPIHTAARDESGSGFALRFPRILNPRHEPAGVRSDRSAEDATSEEEIRRLFALQKRARVTGPP
jgi:DNA ligase-1